MIYNKICGIYGNPVGHSLSPLIHNHLFKKYKFNYEYYAFEIYDIENAIKLIRKENIRGVSITIPFKISVVKYLDKVSDLAGKIGAVNTIVNDNGILTGYNTDAYGVTQTFKKRDIQLTGKNIALLGNGGAAKAVAFSIISEFKINSLKIIGRNKDKLSELLKEIADKTGFSQIAIEEFCNGKYNIKKEEDVIINSASVGMHPETENSLIAEEACLDYSDKIFFDVIYNPRKTLMLKNAESKGATIINGMDMFIFQAMRQHFLWTDNDKIKYEDVVEAL
ncbi:MAG TPA: shikimate dehydrogenase [bacterium]|nr:shikimate dehydrogenase [bacterium]